MAKNKNSSGLVPPPPPTSPSLAAMALLAQQQQQPENPFDAAWEQVGDTAQAQPMENPFDAAWGDAPAPQQAAPVAMPQQAAPPMPVAPMAAPAKPAAAPVKVAPPAITKKAAPPVAAAPAPVAPPNAFEQASNAIGQSVMGTARNAYHSLPNIPIVGPSLFGMAQTAKQAGADYQKDFWTSAAASAAGVPAGLAGFGDDLLNIGRVATGLQNKLPASDMKGAIANSPVVAPFAKAAPGAFEAGAFGGGMLIPVPGAGVAVKGIVSPIAKSLVRGSLAGGAFGVVSAAGKQAKEEGKIDVGKAVMEGALPGALIGGALDSGVSAAGRKIAKARAGKPTAPAEPKPEDFVHLDDGSKFTEEDARVASRDKSIPIEQRAELIEKLDARRRTEAGGNAEQPPITKIVNGKEVTFEGAEAAQVARMDRVFKLREETIKEQYKGAATVQREMLKPLERQYLQDLQNLVSPPEPPRTDYQQSQGFSKMQQKFSQFGKPKTKPAAPAEPVVSQEVTGRVLEPQEVPPPVKPEPVAQALPEPEAAPLTRPEPVKPAEPAAKIEAVPPRPKPPVPELADVREESLNRILEHGTEDQRTAAVGEIIKRTQEPEIAQAEQFTAGPDPDAAKAKKGYNAVFNPDGSIKSSSKRSLAQAQKVADQHNSGAVKPSQGMTDRFRPSTEPSEYRKLLTEDGQPVPETASDSIRGKLSNLAEAKHNYDSLQAEADAAYDAWRGIAKQPRLTSLKRKPVYSPEIEAELVERNRKSADLGFEVTSGERKSGTFTFKPGTDANTAGAKVLEMMKSANEAKRSYEQIRAQSISELDAAVRNGDLPRSLNIDHEKGPVNVRLTPKQQTALKQELIDRQGDVGTVEEVSRTQKQIKDFMGNPKASKSAYDAANGRRSRSGAATIGTLGRKPSNPVSTSEAMAASIAEGARQSKEISDLANNADKVTRVINLRRTLDFAKEQNPVLHNKLWEGIARETRLARGLKFTPEQAPLVEKSLRMDWLDVLDGAEGLDALSFKQRDFLSKRQLIRQNSADAVKSELEYMDEYYNGEMPEKAWHRYKVLQQLEHSLRGRSIEEKGAGDFAIGKDIANALYDYVFKWNTSYHALNLLDPIIVGSARLGPHRIAQAKLAIQMDPKIKEFVKGHEPKDALRQLKEEAAVSNDSLPKGVRRTAVGQAIRDFNNWKNKLPDLPSEAWNYQDAMAASIIEHGDRTGYQGGGGQLLSDMAHGKLSPEAEVKVYTEALQAVQDITGAGSLGLDRDPIQRNPAMRYVVQFASQPYRVTRLLLDWAKAGNWGAIITFGAATAFVSGQAVIPKEVESILQFGPPESRAFLAAAQDMADNVDISKNVFGRDISDKMRTALFPALGGAQANMVMDMVDSRLREAHGQKWDKLMKSTALMALSGVLGGGGLQADKFLRESENIAKGEKEVWATPSTLTKGAGKLLGHQTLKPYSPATGIANALLPGTDTKSGAIIKSLRRKASEK